MSKTLSTRDLLPENGSVVQESVRKYSSTASRSVTQEKEVTSQRKRIQASASGESCIGMKVLANACFKMSFVLPVEELCDVLERVSAGPSGVQDPRPVCGRPEIRSLAGLEEGISNALVSEEESGCVSNCTWQWSPVWKDLTESLWGSD